MPATSAPRALDTVVLARGLRLPRPGGASGPALDFEVFPGEIFVITGGSVDDQTALIDTLAGLRAAVATELAVNGARVNGDLGRRRRVGVAPRHVGFERGLTVSETLDLFAGFHGDRARAAPALEIMHLHPVRRARVDRLPASAGQRLVLTLALMHDPVLFLADDPERNLDLEGARLFRDALQRRRQQGRTSVLSVNRPAEAEHLADRVAVLDDRGLAAVDTPDRLLATCSAPVAITFELPHPSLDMDVLRRLDATEDARGLDGRYTLLSRDGVATLRALMRLFDGLAANPTLLTMRRPTLVEAIAELTSRRRTP